MRDKKISESVSEFAKKFGLKDLSKFEDDNEVLDKVSVMIEEKFKALASEKVKECDIEATSERNFSEWQKYDPKALKSMKLNDPERYAKIPGRH